MLEIQSEYFMINFWRVDQLGIIIIIIIIIILFRTNISINDIGTDDRRPTQSARLQRWN